MNADEFYAKLRLGDKEKVIRIVESIKGFGFIVYAAGSSLGRNDYNDIDLVVTPSAIQGIQTGDTSHFAFSKLEHYLIGLEVGDITQESLNVLAVISSVGYVGSTLRKRFRVRKADTSVDISLVKEPFDLIPETERVLL
ncbi:hypothetical protein HYV88_03970 [Candidatus Woesearchaeota archaeon]|nr:hypothetical protein [Candidatus Woesearchaeota archaeon]